MKLACVVQRYGAGIAGGSEAHCRELAERLAVDHEVTVLTTTATDYVTWANALPAGTTRERDVTVMRFPVARPRRMTRFTAISDEVFDNKTDEARQVDWFRENGPDAPALLDHLRLHGPEYDVVLFWTFRYAPSFFGLPLVADRAVLLPTAEDEPAVYLTTLETFFRRPAGFLFLTPEEQALVTMRAGRPLEPSAVIGMGLEPATPIADRGVLNALGLPERYVLYLGRVDRNKGCRTLFTYFTEYADARGDDAVTLVLAGPAKMRIPDHPRLRALGYVPDDVRNALLTHAQALVVPSPYESLSIALLEGWNHGVPALVNAGCAVLDGQVRRASGGLSYRSSREFAAGLDELVQHDDLRRVLGAQGRAYVDREYRWSVVLSRVLPVLGAVRATRASRGGVV